MKLKLAEGQSFVVWLTLSIEIPKKVFAAFDNVFHKTDLKTDNVNCLKKPTRKKNCIFLQFIFVLTFRTIYVHNMF